MSNDQYNADDVVDRPIDLSTMPHDEEIPMDAYLQHDVHELSESERNDFSLLEAIGNLTPGQLLEEPEFMNQPVYDEAQVETPISKYLLDQIAHIDAEAKAKNPDAKDIDLNTPFPKNTQTQWFAEFNKAAFESGNGGYKLISKPNGYFYKGDEDPHKALEQFGIPAEKLVEYAGHFQMSFFGSTRARTKNNNSNDRGFKSYVMHLKDPTDPKSLQILQEVHNAKQNLIQQKLDKSYDLKKAVEFISAKADSIVAEETNKTGTPPFVGSANRLFLSPAALYAELNEKAPEIKGLYSIQPLDIKGNKVTYTGYSEGLESYFEDDLKICKIVTKNPQKMSQEALEHLITEKLELNTSNEHVAGVPSDALIQQINASPEDAPPIYDAADQPGSPEKPAKTDALTSEVGNNTSPQFFTNPKTKNMDKDVGEPDGDQSHFNRRKSKQAEEEPATLAKMALEALTKAASVTLAAVLALAKLIMQTLMALLAVLARGVTGNYPNGSLIPDNPLLTFNNVLNRKNQTNQLSDEVALTKDLSLKDAANDITSALDADVANDLKLSKEYELSEVKPFDKIELSKEALSRLSIEERARLDNDVKAIFDDLNDQDKVEYLKQINIKAEHGFAESLNSKLSEPLIYDERFGVLLASSDRVSYEGAQYGVVSAAVVAGTLTYAIAKENDQGQYDIKFAKANDLTLEEHNAYNFDNFSNLRNHVHELLAINFEDQLGKIEKLAVVDRNDLKGDEISIEELNNRTNFISFDKLGFDTSSIPVSELIANNPALTTELYYSLPQLHHDKSGELNASGMQNSHPFFGRLLDINDQVDGRIGNGDISIRGSIVGAYETESDLYYQVMHDNQFYSLKAEDTTLVRPNGGDLTEDQMDLMNSKSFEGKEFRKIGIPVDHQASSHKIPLLSRLDEKGFDKSFQFESTNKVILSGGFNTGVVPLEKNENGEYVGSGRLISLKGYDGEPVHFVSVGETINPKDGMKRSLAFEVSNTLTGIKPLSADKSRLVQLNLDDPAIQVKTAGVSNEELKTFARKAREVYENGALRRVANVVAHFANEAKDELLHKKDGPIAIAKEAYVINKVAMGVLQEAAGLTATVANKDIGLDANLSQSTFSADAINKIIENPESRVQVPSQTEQRANPLDIVTYAMTFNSVPVDHNHSLGEILSLNEHTKTLLDPIADMATPTETPIDAPAVYESVHSDVELPAVVVEGVEPVSVAPTIDEPVPVQSDVDLPAVVVEGVEPVSVAPTIDEPVVYEPEQSDVELPANEPEVSIELPSDLALVHDQAKDLAIFAYAYSGGEAAHVADNLQVLELLSEKARLAESYETLKMEAKNVDEMLKSVGLVNPENLSLSEIEYVKTAISSEGLAIHLSNLRDSVDDFAVDYVDHIGSLNKHLTTFSREIEFDNLDEHSVSTVNDLRDLIKYEIHSTVDGVNDVQTLVGKMEFITQNTPDSIQTLMPEFQTRSNELLMQKVAEFDKSVGAQPNANALDNAKNHDSSLDNSY